VGKPKASQKATARGPTARQLAFVREYLVDYNATQAAIRAGYAPRSAAVQAFQNLRNHKIQTALRNVQDQRIERLDVDADAVLRELLQVANSDIGDVLDFSGDTLALRKPSEIPPAVRRAISSVKVKKYVEGKGDDAQPVEIVEFKLWDKISALEKLGKYLGLWRDVVVIKQVEFERYVHAFSAAIAQFVPADRQGACQDFIRSRLMEGNGLRAITDGRGEMQRD
jgi:phage terminase small subunit